MDTLQLITLQKLGKEKSFSRASSELGVSQPTVTTRIKSLEEELGESLVLRTGHKAILTPAGEVFLGYADRALKIYQTGLDRLGVRDETIAVAATGVMSTYVLPQILDSLRENIPAVKWNFLTGSSIDIIRMVKDEIADIGFIRGTIGDEALRCRNLYSEELHLVVPSQHPFAKRGRVGYRDLESERLLIYRRHSVTYQLIEERFRNAGARPNISMELVHVMTVKQMILAGMGIGFLPENAIAEEVKDGRLMIAKLDDSPIFRSVSLIASKRSVSKTAEFVERLLTDILKK